MSQEIGQSWLDKLDNIVAENSKLVLLILGLIVIVFLLVIGYMKMINKIQVVIELPKTIKETGVIVVGKEYANKKYYRMWGREDVEIISSFNQHSIKEKMQYLKSRIYPPFYYKHVKLFNEYQKEISTDLVTQKFTYAKENIITKVDDDGKVGSVLVPGFYSKWIDEDEVIHAQPCEYKLGYIIEGGHIYVDKFKTTCK